MEKVFTKCRMKKSRTFEPPCVVWAVTKEEEACSKKPIRGVDFSRVTKGELKALVKGIVEDLADVLVLNERGADDRRLSIY